MLLIRALHAELLKLKRTLAFRVIFVWPFFAALLQFFVMPMNLFLEGRFTTALVLGIGGGVVAALLGCFEFVRCDVA